MSVADLGVRFVVLTFSSHTQQVHQSLELNAQNWKCMILFYSDDLKLVKRIASSSEITSDQYYDHDGDHMNLVHWQFIVLSPSFNIASDYKSSKLKEFTRDLCHYIKSYCLFISYSDPRCIHALSDESVIISFCSGHVRKFELKLKEVVLKSECKLTTDVAGISSDSA